MRTLKYLMIATAIYSSFAPRPGSALTVTGLPSEASVWVLEKDGKEAKLGNLPLDLAPLKLTYPLTLKLTHQGHAPLLVVLTTRPKTDTLSVKLPKLEEAMDPSELKAVSERRTEVVELMIDFDSALKKNNLLLAKEILGEVKTLAGRTTKLRILEANLELRLNRRIEALQLYTEALNSGELAKTPELQDEVQKIIKKIQSSL